MAVLPAYNHGPWALMSIPLKEWSFGGEQGGMVRGTGFLPALAPAPVVKPGGHNVQLYNQ